MEQIQWTCVQTGNKNTCTISNSSPFYTPFFSSGNLMISILLLLIFLVQLIGLLRGAFNNSKVDIYRNYQGNNSPDGKEFYKI